MKKRNEILEIIFEFALDIIEYSELMESKRKFAIANQILKSGTSIGANVKEAQSCESKLDFIHKLKIAHKEAEETGYWFQLCERAKTYPDPTDMMKTNLLSIQKLLSKIISTSRSKLKEL